MQEDLRSFQSAEYIGRTQEVQNLIARAIRSEKEMLKGHRVFFFGSRVAGNARERSDFDIGIEGKEPLSSVAFHKLKDKLEQLPTLCKIDLVDLTATSPDFRDEAHKSMEVILE